MRALVVAAVLAAGMGSQASAADGEKIGNWTLTQTKDSLTDKVSVSALVVSGADDALELGCDPDETPGRRTVMFVHNPYLGSGDRGFTYRLDETPAVTFLGGYRSQSMVMNDPADRKPFLAGLKPAKRLRVRMTDGAFAPLGVEFNVTGADQVFARMDTLCGAAR